RERRLHGAPGGVGPGRWVSGLKAKHIQTKVFLSRGMVRALDEHARRTRLGKSGLARAAIAAFLSLDGSEPPEAVLRRRLDRVTRQNQDLARDQAILIEAV